MGAVDPSYRAVVEPLVGRDLELGLLRAAAEATGRRAVVLTGEAGSGKTRMLSEAAALPPAAQTWTLRGYEPESIAPLASAADLLHDLLGDWRWDETEVVRLFEAALRALDARAGPLRVLVDDVQWLDGATSALVHYLLRGTAADLLVVAAGRPHPVTGSLHEAITGLLPPGSVQAVHLGPLDEQSTAALLRSIDSSLNEEEVAEFSRTAGGSPFWLRLLAQEGGSTATTALVRTRLSACSRDAAELARLLAVAARPLSSTDAAQVLGWPTDRVGAAASALIGRGLVSERHGEIAVSHDLVREAVVTDLTDGVRSGIHGRLARWLEDSHTLSALLAAVWHRVAAGDPVGDLLARLVLSPQRRLLDGDAVTALSRLAAAPDVRVNAALLTGLAALAMLAGEPAAALPVWLRVAEIDPSPGLALLEAARAAFQLDDVPQTRQHLALARATGPEPTLAVRLDVLESRVLRWGEDRFDEASVLAARALAGATAVGSPQLLAEALSAAIDDALGRGDIDAVIAGTQQMAALAQGDETLEQLILYYRLFVLQLTEEHRAAEELVLPHWAAAENDDHPGRLLDLTDVLLQSLLAQDRARDAADLVRRTWPVLQRSRGLSRRFDIGADLNGVECTVQQVQALNGDWRGAVSRILELGNQMTRHLGTFPLRCAADLTVRLGGPDEAGGARELCERALAAAAAVGCPRCLHETRLEMARLLAALGDLERAREVLPEGPHSSQLQRRWFRWASNLLDGDVEALGALRDEYSSSGCHLSALWLGADLAGILPHDEAVALLEELVAFCDEGGSSNAAAALRRRLRDLGARPWRRGRTAAAELSDRERQVAELMASGATNPEIAAALFLSRKTVEHHASRVLAKVGARNRTEVAARLTDG